IESRGLNVALHAQVAPTAGFVVGSAVTTAGMQKAFLQHGKEEELEKDRLVAHAQIFFPFQYDGLHDRSWHIVIIEGWFEMINAFIHEVRALSHPVHTKVLFYCLDPQLPGLHHLTALDIDGFLTNSMSTKAFLAGYAPTIYVPLAVDPEAFPFYPSRPCSEGNGGDAKAGACRKVVYVGAAGALKHKRMLRWMLREAAPYGLDIYGSGWAGVHEFSRFWKGVLPDGELGLVYGKALAVLGVTMDDQRENGMVNNRVFEALAVGAPLISDCFPELDGLFFDNLIFCVKVPGDVDTHINRLINDGSGDMAALGRQQRRETIVEGHTWAHRVSVILQFIHDLLAEPGEEGQCWRTGCLNLALVADPGLKDGLTLGSTFSPAVARRLEAMYRIYWLQAEDVHNTRSNSVSEHEHIRSNERDKLVTEELAHRHGTEFLSRDIPRKVVEDQQPQGESQALGYLWGYDMVWAVGRWGGPADLAVRKDLGATGGMRVHSTRLMVQLRGLVLWGEAPSVLVDSGDGLNREEYNHGHFWTKTSSSEELSWYDVVYYQTEWDRTRLTEFVKGRPLNNLQHAWGIGSAVPTQLVGVGNSSDRRLGRQESELDMLVIGTDSQIPDMLQQLREPDLLRFSLGVIVTPSSLPLTIRPGIASVLAASGISTDTNTALNFTLPLRLSLTVAEAGEAPTFKPLLVEVLLIRMAEDAEELASAAKVASKVLVMADGDEGVWATLLAITSARDFKTVQVSDIGSDRAKALAKFSPYGWDVDFYARQLVAGMTRALCLGRGNSKLTVVRPSTNGTVVQVPEVIAFEVAIEDFRVGRDGEWCLLAGEELLICVWRHQLTIMLHFVSSMGSNEWASGTAQARVERNTLRNRTTTSVGKQASGELGEHNELPIDAYLQIVLRAELRSNMYQNILYRSQDIPLLICP
ncbi:unnamed protein product, partial [Choristocarpus tenellus]